MGSPVAVVIFAVGATVLEIALVAFVHFSLLELIAIGPALFGTELLVVTWHPAELLSSRPVYIAAVAILDFSPLGFLLSAV